LQAVVLLEAGNWKWSARKAAAAILPPAGSPNLASPLAEPAPRCQDWVAEAVGEADEPMSKPTVTTPPWRTKLPEGIPIPGIETKSPVPRPGFLFGLREFPVLAPPLFSLHQTTRSNPLRQHQRTRVNLLLTITDQHPAL